MPTPKSKLEAEPAQASGPKPEPKSEPGVEPERKPEPKRKRWGLRIALVAACLVIAAGLVLAGFAAGSRWLRYNDEHDIEGTWYVDGTDVPIAFADGQIVFDSDTAYAYSIDSQAKTITYSLGDLQGQGRYWFSDDRGTLILTDGADYTMWSTLFDDLAYDVSRLFGNDALPAGEGSIVLTHAITLSDGKGADERGAADSGGDSSDQSDDQDGDQGADQGGERTDERADTRPGGKDDFSDLSVSDVLMKEDATDDGEER